MESVSHHLLRHPTGTRVTSIFLDQSTNDVALVCNHDATEMNTIEISMSKNGRIEKKNTQQASGPNTTVVVTSIIHVPCNIAQFDIAITVRIHNVLMVFGLDFVSGDISIG
jgi:hypothetical protein